MDQRTYNQWEIDCQHYNTGSTCFIAFNVSTEQEWREEAPLPQDEIIRPYWNHVFTAGQECSSNNNLIYREASFTFIDYDLVIFKINQI